MKTDEKEKYYLSYIKSAQSTVALTLLLNLIFIIRTFFSKSTDFWFSLYSTQFAIKGSGFFADKPATISLLSAIVIILAGIIPLAAALVTAMKKPKKLYLCLVFYIADFVFLLYGLISDPFSDVTSASYIDLIFHTLVTLFIIVGIYAERKNHN